MQLLLWHATNAEFCGRSRDRGNRVACAVLPPHRVVAAAGGDGGGGGAQELALSRIS